MLKLNLRDVFFVSSVLLIQPLFLDTLNFPSQTSFAQAQTTQYDPHNGVVNSSQGDWFKARDTNIYYNRELGQCLTRDSNGNVVQNISGCRKTWYAIARIGERSILFYDKNAGDIEIYEISNGIGRLQQRLAGSARKSWKKVGTMGRKLTPSDVPGGYTNEVYFQDNDGTRERYDYTESRGLHIVRR